MEPNPQHHAVPQNDLQHDQPTVCSCRFSSHDRTSPRSSRTRNKIMDIQILNNRASVLVAMGRYFEAISLFGEGLKGLKAVMDGIPQQRTNFFCTCAGMGSAYSHDHYNECDPMNTLAVASIKSDDLPNHSYPTQRHTPHMSSNSQVKTNPYAGQEVFNNTSTQSSGTWMYQQVYSKPVLMKDSEWKDASFDNRSLALIFNSAISYHLWGMKLSSESTISSDSTKTSSNCLEYDPLYLFQKSKTLYRLAFHYIKQQIKGVDPICIPALFNNLSHVCKTLEGPYSNEAYFCDVSLLKSVCWWMYSGPADDTNTRERLLDEEKTQIIKAFLETTFYLIGNPRECEIASAA